MPHVLAVRTHARERQRRLDYSRHQCAAGAVCLAALYVHGTRTLTADLSNGVIYAALFLLILLLAILVARYR